MSKGVNEMAFFDDIGKSINNMTQSARKTADVAVRAS